MNIQILPGSGNLGKKTPTYGTNTQGGSAAFAVVQHNAPRKIRIFGTTVQCIGGLGTPDVPGFLRVTVQERWNAAKNAPGDVFIDEAFDAAGDEFTAFILGSSFSLPLGIDAGFFDVEELFVTVWASGGRETGPTAGTAYANIKVICDLGFADVAV